jgi:hypothetical protein
LCIPTILISSEKFDEALAIIEKGIKICEDVTLNKTLGKLYLMRASVLIVLQKDKESIDQELEKMEEFLQDNKEIKGELLYLKAV